MNTQTIAPVFQVRNPTERIQVVDALRGFALIGILFVHISMFFYAGYPPAPLQKLMHEGVANQILSRFQRNLCEWQVLHHFFLSFRT